MLMLLCMMFSDQKPHMLELSQDRVTTLNVTLCLLAECTNSKHWNLLISEVKGEELSCQM